MCAKTCPKCNAQYPETANYCRACGLELLKPKNACSENKGAMCRTLTFNDDDVYCECCGSLTTYAVARNAAQTQSQSRIGSIPMARV
jgi:ribosomal protein L40E